MEFFFFNLRTAAHLFEMLILSRAIFIDNKADISNTAHMKTSLTFKKPNLNLNL